MNSRFRRVRVGGVCAAGVALVTSLMTLGGSAGASNTTSSAQIAAATAEVLAAMKTPTGINQTVPLKTKPAKGKTIVFIQCDLASCADIGSGIKAGANALGWNYKQLSYQNANPTTLVTAMQQALAYHPTAVSFSGQPQSLWASEIPAYQMAHAIIIPVVIGPNPVSKTVPVNIGDFTAGGTSLGNWFIKDSKGKGHALIVDIPAFPVLTEYKTGAIAAIKKNCPACVVSSFEGTLPEVGGGTLVPDIVAALQKDPSIKYLLLTDDIFYSSLPSALKAAGLTGIKIAGGQPEGSDLQNIVNGTESAGVLISNPILGWEVVDSVARYLEHMRIAPLDGGTQQQLLTSANVKSFNLKYYITPRNYPSLFKKLWKVG